MHRELGSAVDSLVTAVYTYAERGALSDADRRALTARFIDESEAELAHLVRVIGEDLRRAGRATVPVGVVGATGIAGAEVGGRPAR